MDGVAQRIERKCTGFCTLQSKYFPRFYKFNLDFGKLLRMRTRKTRMRARTRTRTRTRMRTMMRSKISTKN